MAATAGDESRVRQRADTASGRPSAGPETDAAATASEGLSETRSGHWCRQGSRGPVRFRLYGKPLAIGSHRATETTIVEDLRARGLEIARLRQSHSPRVLEARPGDCGAGDALVTSRANLALRIVTADCVPVLLLSDRRVAAIHAGWRGIRSDIVSATIAAWGDPPPEAAIIGPAIGPCCYEVSNDVAREVARASGSAEVVVAGEPRPHLDLALAVEHQLARESIQAVLRVGGCTRCEAERLWSYRREGQRAGRNLAFVWIHCTDLA